MLLAAHKSICSAQDRAKLYVDKGRRKVTFEEGDFVFLKVPPQSETMKTRKCNKISPRYSGPFKILKRIGDVAYKLELPESSQVHHVFHVSKLKKSIHGLKNVVSLEVLVELIEPPIIPHKPEKVLGHPDRQTHHNVYQELLVKWIDKDEEAVTWERHRAISKKFL